MATAPAISRQTDQDSVYHFKHDARLRALFRVFLRNLLLCLVTLLLYVPVARSNIRRALTGRLSLMGARLEYLGTGRELLVGLLLATVVIILPLVAWLWLLIWAAQEFAQGIVSSGLAWLLILTTLYGVPLVLLGAGLYQAMRYRLHRTAWRGIRFGMSSGAWIYGLRFSWLVLVDICTLFLLHPVLMNALARLRFSAVSFGTVRLRYDGAAARFFYPRYVLYWALFVPTLGFSWLWYRALWLSFVMQNIHIGGLTFRFDATGWDYARYQVVNMCLLVGSLGLLLPLVWRRRLDFFCRHVTVTGSPDFAAIEQAPDARALRGEGLEDLLGFRLGPFGFGDM